MPIWHRGQHQGWLLRQPTGDESEHRAAWLVQPLRIVDGQQHGGVLGRLIDDLERRQADEEQLGSARVRQSERREQRGSQAPGQPIGRGHEGLQQLMEAGEWHLYL